MGGGHGTQVAPHADFSPDSSQHGVSGQCITTCLNPHHFWLFRMFQPGLTQAHVDDPCQENKYGHYERTTVEGAGLFNMTVDVYSKTNEDAPGADFSILYEESVEPQLSQVIGPDGTYYKLVKVAGVDGCVQTDVSASTAKAFGGKPGTCAALGYTVPTGTQKIPFCCTVHGFKKP